MSAASLPHDPLLPQAPGGSAPGAALALVVHAGLIAALALGVDWRAHAPEVVSAELWAAVPQIAAAPPPPPAAVEPTPAPKPVPAPPPPQKAEAPAPDITLDRERERKKAEERERLAEQKKAEDEKKKREKLEADKAARAKAEEERLASQREENLRRMLAQANTGAPAATGMAPSGTAAANAAPSATYAGKVRAAIRPNIVFAAERSSAGNTAAEVEVVAAPGGSIISRTLLKRSGNPEWDDAVLRAIDKTATLPRDTDGRVPSRLIISFRPND
jgi:colicin import membrane protein